jgi:hypothetical protein
MRKQPDSPHWIGRILGGIVVAAGVFISLCFWDTWELNMSIRIGVAIVCGLMFLCLGGNVWRWIYEIDYWT